MSGSTTSRNHGREATRRAEELKRICTRAPPKRVRRALALLTKTYHGSRLTVQVRSSTDMDGFLVYQVSSRFASCDISFSERIDRGPGLLNPELKLCPVGTRSSILDDRAEMPFQESLIAWLKKPWGPLTSNHFNHVPFRIDRGPKSICRPCRSGSGRNNGFHDVGSQLTRFRITERSRWSKGASV